MKPFFPQIFNNIITYESNVREKILDDSKNSKSTLLTYFNQHCFNIYYDNVDYRRLVDNSFTVFLDGLGIFYALKFLGIKSVEKFNASDFYSKMLGDLAARKESIYFIGANIRYDLFCRVISDNSLNSAGYKNGFDDIDDEQSLLDQIKKANPRIVILGLGVPKQELVAYTISKKIDGLRIICVGNFLEFYFGTKKRAPIFLRNSGFEWLFRLSTEPKRLWKRYILGIPLFFYRILRIYLYKK